MKKRLTALLLLATLAIAPAAQAAEAADWEYMPIVEREAERWNLAPSLVWAVCMAVSSLDVRADSGSSKGLMQLNVNTYPTLAQDLQISDFDPFDAEHNIMAGTYKLALERDYWYAQGYSDEDTFAAMLISYNRGRAGAKKYMNAHGLDADYVDKVLEYKCQLEQGLI